METKEIRARAMGLAMTVLVVACRAGSGDAPEPVPECQEYERLYNSCMGQKLAIASQPAALASSEEQRARLKKLCSENLARLKQGCR